MKYFFVVVGLMLLISSLPGIAGNPEILKQTPNELILKYKLPPFTLSTITKNNINYSSISGDFVKYHNEEGSPKLPFYSDNIGIPEDGSIDFSVIGKKDKVLTNVLICPNDRMVIKDELGNELYTVPKDVNKITKENISNEYYLNQAVYGNSRLYPGKLVDKTDRVFFKDRAFANIIFNPFQYNPKEKKLIVTEEITIRILINGTKTANKSLSGKYEKADQGFYLNNETSKYWAKQIKKNAAGSQTKNETDVVSELQFLINKKGIYKITYEYLTARFAFLQDSLGFSTSLDFSSLNPKFLELKDKNGPIPMNFYGESDDQFGPGDYFEFYGEMNHGEESYYDNNTNDNVYTLFLSDHIGTRMAVENGGLQVTDKNKFINPDAFEYTEHFEKQMFSDRLGLQTTYSGNPNYFREDTMFWKSIPAPNLEALTFNLDYPINATTRYFSSKISLFGITYNLSSMTFDHHAIIRMNAALIDQHTWSGQKEQIFQNETALANMFLTDGTNFLYIDLPGDGSSGPKEQIYLDYFDVTYWREFKTRNNYLEFTKPSNKPLGLYQFELKNFTRQDVSIYKLGCSVFNNIQVLPFNETGIGPYRIVIQDSVISANIKYIALTEDMKLQPHKILPNFPSDLMSNANAANVIVISKKEFLEDEGTQLYKSTYEQKGYQVKLVDIQDIYDEFNQGIKSEVAIKDFLSYAYYNWGTPQINNVLLLGDGIFDKRNLQTVDKYDIIPIRNVWTNKHGATASDNWYACLVGDDPVADINISRINVWEQSQIMPIVQKTVTFYNGSFSSGWAGKAVLAAGGKIEDGNDIFATQSETVRQLSIPNYYQVERVYTGNLVHVPHEYSGTTSKLIDNMDDGICFLQFMGHGGGRIWADYNLMNVNNIADLNNDVYPFVSSMACFGSAFDTEGSACIGESFVMQPAVGAISHIGFSGFGYLDLDLDYSLYLTDGFFNQNLPTVGDVVTYTKAQLYGLNGYYFNPSIMALVSGSVLLGDPLIQFTKPERNYDVVENNNNYNPQPGDTLQITCTFPDNVFGAKVMVCSENEIILNRPLIDYPVINNKVEFQYKVPTNIPGPYSRRIKFMGYSAEGQSIAVFNYSVGNSAVTDVRNIPEKPTFRDSVYIKSRILDKDGIKTVKCVIDTVENEYTRPPLPKTMYFDAVNNEFITLTPFAPFKPGSIVKYHFEIVDSTDSLTVTPKSSYNFKIETYDIAVLSLNLTQENKKPVIKVLTQNLGQIISRACYLRLYDISRSTREDVLIDSVLFDPLNSLEKRWDSIEIPLLNGVMKYKLLVNKDYNSEESSFGNNAQQMTFNMNMFMVTNQAMEHASLDNNFIVQFPANMTQDSSVFYISKTATETPTNQADIERVKLYSGVDNLSYEINTLNPDLLSDSLGHFANNKKIQLLFNYNRADTLTQQLEGENSYRIYRWEPLFRKWINQGGYVSQQDNTVSVEVNRTGIYTLMRNRDRKAPSIDVNIEGQEFTMNGYVSGKGVLSFIFTDANGIDIFDHPIEVSLNGVAVDKSAYTVSAIPGHLSHIPMKLQLNLEQGNYSMVISCTDVNGNFNTKPINFKVSNTFDLIRIANYPNPVIAKTIDPANSGRTRFTYTLTDDADYAEIKVFTVTGRLVKTFKDIPSSVGYHEYPRSVYGWDCTDESGYELANGVYFYKVIAKKRSNRIEKICKMAILK